MQTKANDRVVKEMLRECFGDGAKEAEACVMVYFGCIVEEMKEMGAVLVPGLGALKPRFLVSWNLNRKGKLGLKDRDGVARLAVEEIRSSGYDEEACDMLIDRYKLREYAD